MKYANTAMISGIELVVTVMPLSMVPGFDPENPPQSGTYGVPDNVEVGWQRLADGTFTPYTAPAVVPSSCTRGQGRITLLETPHGESNKLFAFEAMLATIQDPTEKKRAEVEYERETWERGNAFLQQSWAALGGTEAELDALFILAVTK